MGVEYSTLLVQLPLSPTWFVNMCYTTIFTTFLSEDPAVWWHYMLEMAFYWSLFFTQFFDVKRKVGNTIDVGLDEHPGLLGDVHPPRGHPGPPHP